MTQDSGQISYLRSGIQHVNQLTELFCGLNVELIYGISSWENHDSQDEDATGNGPYMLGSSTYSEEPIRA